MGRGKSESSLRLVEAAHDILSEIHPATVRAVCYQLFIQGLIDSMSKANTNKVSTQLVWAREHDEVRWDWIVDESREVERAGTWDNPGAFIEAAKRSYRRDAWQQQPIRLQVWSEKATVRGTVAPTLTKYGIDFQIYHGYGSATSVHDAALDSREGDPLKAFYIGDYDASGLHMSKVDLPRRLERYGGSVEIIRLALNRSDIRSENKLPWFPLSSKRKDPRYGWYKETTGLDRCWELDALSPVVLRERLENAILAEIDLAAWERMKACEKAEQESLAACLDVWNKITASAKPRPRQGWTRVAFQNLIRGLPRNRKAANRKESDRKGQ
jgi:hypothetical protein